MPKKIEFEESDTDSSASEQEESSSDSSGSTDESGDKSRQSTSNETKISDKSFQFSCLHNWESEKLSTHVKSHMQRLKEKEVRDIDDDSHAGMKGKGPLTKDFTPWWEKFIKSHAKPTSVGPVKTSAKRTSIVDDSYLSWFNNCPTAQTGLNWLCGDPGPKAGSGGKKTKVEDIEVPSIYENKSEPKGRRALKRERKAESEKTTGEKWFGMKAPDVDERLKNDMELIQMRGVLDPKRFYKHRDRRGLPKYFQMGTVVDEGTDFYSSRLTKKQRKQTLVEELMNDASIRQYNKRKYGELQQKMRGKGSKVKKK